MIAEMSFAEKINHARGPKEALHEAEVRLTQRPTSPSHGGQQDSSYSQLPVGTSVEVANPQPALLAVGLTSGQEIGHGGHWMSAEATTLDHVRGNPGTPPPAPHEIKVVL